MALELSGKPNFLAGLSSDISDMEAQDIKPDIYYRYLTGLGEDGWRGWNSPDAFYVDIVINRARRNNAIPMITYYSLAQIVEESGMGVFKSAKIFQYMDDLEVMFNHIAKFDIPILVHLEPDLFGYFQKYKIDPLTTNVGNQVGTVSIAGMFKNILEMGKRIAPKCKIGFHASQWGDWFSWTDPNADVQLHAESVANYVAQFGQCDFITLEMSDRDAGFYEARGEKDRYWDETNTVLPHYNNYLDWASAVIDRTGKPGIFWQLPLGVPSDIFGTEYHYRDNRVKYLFSHIEDLIATGVFGMVFGSGKKGQTIISTDEYQFRDAIKKYKANPIEIGNSGGDGTGLDFGADKKLQIHCIGDSITESTGWRTTIYNELKNDGIETDFIGSTADKYPKSPESEHDAYGGTTTHHVLKNIDGWYEKILNPELTIIMIGTNDVAWWMAESVSAVVARVEQIINKIKANAPYSTVLLCSIPPVSSKIIEIVKRDRQLLCKTYNLALDNLAYRYKEQKVRFVDVYDVLTLDDLRDGIHPNAEGNRKIGELLAAEIKGLLA